MDKFPDAVSQLSATEDRHQSLEEVQSTSSTLRRDNLYDMESKHDEEISFSSLLDEHHGKSIDLPVENTLSLQLGDKGTETSLSSYDIVATDVQTSPTAISYQSTSTTTDSSKNSTQNFPVSSANKKTSTGLQNITHSDNSSLTLDINSTSANDLGLHPISTTANTLPTSLTDYAVSPYNSASTSNRRTLLLKKQQALHDYATSSPTFSGSQNIHTSDENTKIPLEYAVNERFIPLTSSKDLTKSLVSLTRSQASLSHSQDYHTSTTPLHSNQLFNYSALPSTPTSIQKHGNQVVSPSSTSLVPNSDDQSHDKPSLNEKSDDLPPEESHLDYSIMQGYVDSWDRFLLHIVLCLTLNIVYALFWAWFPELWVRIRYKPVSVLSDAEYVHIRDKQTRWTLVKVERIRAVCDFEQTNTLLQESERQEIESVRLSQTIDNSHSQTSWFSSINSCISSFLPSIHKKSINTTHCENASTYYSSSLSYNILTVPLHERMIVFRNRRFLYSTERKAFVLLRSENDLLLSDLNDAANGIGLTTEEYRTEKKIFGCNILHVPVPSIPTLLITEVLHPFFVFQIYSVILWCCEEYYIFATVIGLMAVASTGITVYEARNNVRKLQELAQTVTEVTVVRNGVPRTVDAFELVPGDLIELNECIDVPCDLTLLTGSAVVNESMLTGESVPVVKYPIIDTVTPLDQSLMYSIETIQSSMNSPTVNIFSPVPTLSRHTHPYTPLTLEQLAKALQIDVNSKMEVGKDSRTTLFAGSSIMQLKKPVSNQDSNKSDPIYAIVVRTGFSTTKGNMISSMLYPPKSTFKFEQQSFRFVGILFILAIIGCLIAFWKYYKLGAPRSTIILRALDLITIVVPPSLPLAMSIGTNFSILCLKKLKIFCIAPSRVNFAGKIKMMCFDKTGTLTSDTLQFKAVHSLIEFDKTSYLQRYLETLQKNHQKPSKYTSPRSAFTLPIRLSVNNVNDEATYDNSVNNHRYSYSDLEKANQHDNAFLPSSPLLLSQNDSMNTQHTRPDAHSPSSSDIEKLTTILFDTASSGYTTDANILPPLVRSCLATCHSLALHDGEFLGDPLEIEGYVAAKANYTLPTMKGVLFHSKLLLNTPDLKPTQPITATFGDEDPLSLQYRNQESLQDSVSDETNPIRGQRSPSIKQSSFDDTENPHNINSVMNQSLQCQCDCHYYSNYFLSSSQLPSAMTQQTAEFTHVFCDCACNNTISNTTIYNPTSLYDTSESTTFESSAVQSNNDTEEQKIHIPDSASLQNEYIQTILDPYKQSIFTPALNNYYTGLANHGVVKPQRTVYNDNLPISHTSPVSHISNYNSTSRISNLQATSNATMTPQLSLCGTGINGRGWAVIKQFPFESQLQRMSVIACNELDGSYHVFAKGSPEMIGKLSNASSLPADYYDLVDKYTDEGYRVIALATKTFNITQYTTSEHELSQFLQASRENTNTIALVNDILTRQDFTHLRDSIECNYNLLGLFILENRLKPATIPTILQLQNANIRNVMVTGDNIKTAISISKQCDIIKKNCAVFLSRLPTHLHGKKVENPNNLSQYTPKDIEWVCQQDPSLTLDPYTFKIRFQNEQDITNIKFDVFELAVTGNCFTVLTNDHNNRVTALAYFQSKGGNLVSFHYEEYLYQQQNGTLDQYIEDSKKIEQDSNNVSSTTNSSTTSGVPLSESEKASAAAASFAQAMFAFEYPYIRSLDIITPLQRVILGGCIFARMTPDQKASLVSHYQKLGMYVGMCGDGANDCGALKTAHIGVSLAESEASIAAPFTSQISDISCIPYILAEGRSALSTCFQLFKFMALYSFIQFCACICLYFMGGNFCDYQFLYQDLFAVFPLSILMGRTPASNTLTKKRPSGNLLSKMNLSSLSLHMLTAGFFQIFIYNYVKSETGYQTFENNNWTCSMWEATSLHYFVCFQYVLYATLFSFARPWKKFPWRNLGLSICIAASSLLSFSFFWFGPSSSSWLFFLNDDLELPLVWREKLLFILLIHILITLFIEYGILRFIAWCGTLVYAKRRTHTIYGKGSNRLSEGAKPYHLLRREFEDNFPQNWRNRVNGVTQISVGTWTSS